MFNGWRAVFKLGEALIYLGQSNTLLDGRNDYDRSSAIFDPLRRCTARSQSFAYVAEGICCKDTQLDYPAWWELPKLKGTSRIRSRRNTSLTSS